MNDEAAKKGKLNAIKRHIKEHAVSRHEKKRVQRVKDDRQGTFGQLVFGFEDQHEYGIQNSQSLQSILPESEPMRNVSSRSTPKTNTDFPTGHDGPERLNSQDLFSQEGVFELDFTAKYLDHVFPFLFPFYKPAIFETGRSWLLSLLKHSKIALHTALGLSSFFFAVALNNAYGDDYAYEKSQTWHRLTEHADHSFEGMQMDVRALLGSGCETTVLEKVRMIESIIHVLLFESVIGRSGDWEPHLTPAVALFRQILEAVSDQKPKMLSALLSIGSPVWYKLENDSYIWNPDQAGFRFFTSLLVFTDIIATTAQRREPSLKPLHNDILGEDTGAPVLGFTRVRLSSVLGVQNSVMLAIAEGSSLGTQKESDREMEDAVKIKLNDRLMSVVDELEPLCKIPPDHEPWNDSVDAPGLAFQSYSVRATTRSPSTMTTAVWALAAQIYLLSIAGVSEYDNISVDMCIDRIISIIQRTPSRHLRTLAWPLCVAGCFASISRRDDIRKIFQGQTDLQLIGSPKEAWQVIQEVWRQRGDADEHVWDGSFHLNLASCLNVLGRAVLLI